MAPRKLVFVVIALLWCAGVQAAPSAKLWPRWQAHDADAQATIDHSAFDHFLSRYVVAHDRGPNGVRYDAVTPDDAKQLAAYIAHLEQIDIDHYSRPVQRAYWINLYNAETLHLVISHWPVDSIRNIDSGLFDAGPWDEKRLHVNDVALSLNDIEHRILRPIWADGMTHYGVNCASISCPSLRTTAYSGENVDTALADNARAYINSREGVRFVDGKLVVSSIYQWYAQDFGGAKGVVAHLQQFARPQLSARLADYDTPDRYAYDWHINSEARVAAMATKATGE